MKRKSSPARIGAILILAPAVLVLAGGPALAADVVVSNSETIQAHLNADGTVRDARVYEQIAMAGKGSVTMANPVSTENLRNLDGFGGFNVKDGKMVTTQAVDGQALLRGVSDYGKVLPLKVAVTYKLDGKTVKAGDVVGKAGRLEVHYKVDNVTGKDQNVTYDDGTGKQVTQTQKVVIPMVGTLTTVLPPSFVDVASDEANMAGDGRGATKMSFTMTLFGPIGSATSEFGYSAAVTHGVIPDATISALPVSPLDSPSFKGGAASYKAGADSGIQLTAGVTKIDANVLKLRDGAATLIAGLIKLSDGAGQLSTAFKDPSGGLDLNSGSAALNSGVSQISSGLTQLSGVTGLPSALAGLQVLRAGLNHPVGAAGATDPGGLLQGLQQIAGGLSNPACSPTNPTNPLNPCGVKQGLAAITLGVSNPGCSLADPTNSANPCGIKEIVKFVGDKLTKASSAGGDIAKLGAAVVGAYQQSTYLLGGVATACPMSAAPTIPVPPVVPPSSLVALGLPTTGVCYLLSSAAYGLMLPSGALSPSDLGGLKAQTASAGGALGLTGAGIDGRLLPGLAQLQAGVDKLSTGSASARDAVATLILPGVDSLVAGITDAVTGSQKLSAGALLATSGSRDLAAGIVKAGAGAGQLADGLVTAAAGGKALPEGASQLSAEGTSKIVEAGKSTASDYGLKYALIVAGAERAKTEAMAYGAPANAAGTTAYSLEISGANSDGGRSLGRGVGALALFGAGSGLALFRRRLV